MENNITPLNLPQKEQALLVFLEMSAVDCVGKVRTTHMVESDFEIAKRWNEEGFVMFGEIEYEDIENNFTHWCELSDLAWMTIANIRKERALRGVQGKVYKKKQQQE